MGTVYITQEDAFIGKIDERLNVRFDKKTILDVPLIKVDGVVVLGRATISPAAISELLERNIPLTFLTENGRYLGRLEPEVTKNIFVRKAQWLAAGESPQAIHLVQGFVRGKLKNYRQTLIRRQRESTELDLSKNISRIEQAIAPIDTTTNINSLRGLEGAGSAAYFVAFNQLIRNTERSDSGSARSGLGSCSFKVRAGWHHYSHPWCDCFLPCCREYNSGAAVQG